MFLYYNIIWIICLILLFISLLMLFKRRNDRARRIPHSNQSESYVIVDMNGVPTQQPSYPATYAPPPARQSTATHPSASSNPNNTFYRPPDTSDPNPPPPSYQEYSKDYRIPQA